MIIDISAKYATDNQWIKYEDLNLIFIMWSN